MMFLRKYWFQLVTLCIILLRFAHFGETIDDPHSWRQYDTQQYIDGYYLDNNPFLEPSVCWMGGHETLLLEYPLPEFIVAKAYSLFGNKIWVGRLFFLLSFSLASYFLFKSLKLLFDNWVPEIATICFMLAPLSLFYSRAIHIDFFALAFVFGMLYFSMKAIRTQNNITLLVSVFFACIALLEKAPYTFYFALPIFVFAIQEKRAVWFLKRAGFFCIPVILLIFWSRYSVAMNEQIPNWDQIPNFNRFTDMWYWYFGTWNQRMRLDFWTGVMSRIYFEIIGFIGLVLGIIGAIFYTKSKQYWWLVSVFVGTVIYWVLFFNLNQMHNYYQIPFIFPLVVFMALGIQCVLDVMKKKSYARVCATIILGLYAFQSIQYAETNYYTVNSEFNKVAGLIRENTDRNDIIIVSYGGLTPQCPIILQPAGRKGFSIPGADLTPELIYNLYLEAGVQKIAVVYDGYFTGNFQQFFEAMDEKKGFPIDENGKALYICTLNFEMKK